MVLFSVKHALILILYNAIQNFSFIKEKVNLFHHLLLHIKGKMTRHEPQFNLSIAENCLEVWHIRQLVPTFF